LRIRFTDPLKGWHRLSRYEKSLILLFVLTLPLANPWVRGDGVGYYAYARAVLIQKNLQFEKDWQAANPTFQMGKIDEKGNIQPQQYTRTGHLDNHFAVGPAILWAPFLLAAHLGVLAFNALGGHIPADGFSRPYTLAMALGTAFYGFWGLFFSYRLACKYFQERWAFLATLGIWFGSSLPVYMYFNPSWSHAHSAFAVALFFWYWDRTRPERTYAQWALLGLCAGLMFDVYYPNGILMVVPLAESLTGYIRALRKPEQGWLGTVRLFASNLVFLIAVFTASLPTFLTRKIIYGSPLDFGSYTHSPWHWTSPVLGQLLFSSDHGLLSWTPILILAALGLIFLWKRDRVLDAYIILGTLAFYYVIASYPSWDGLSSYGNRFFVSLVPIFALGLTATIDAFASLWRKPAKALTAAWAGLAVFLLWNFGLIFQWGTHLIPARGPISWKEMAYNQVAVVPAKLSQNLKNYLIARHDMMRDIEQADVKQLEEKRAKEEQNQP